MELLKADNDHLNSTVNELHTIIEDLDQAMANYFGSNQLQEYIKDEAVPQAVPFARTFSHSLEEINNIKLSDEGSIKTSDFASFIFDLRRDT